MCKYYFFNKRFFFFFKYAILLNTGILIFSVCYCQCRDSKKISSSIAEIKSNNALTNTQKLKAFYILKRESDACRLAKDSIYTNILENISEYEFQAKNYDVAIAYILQALHINKSGKNYSRFSAIKNYSILAHYYEKISLFNKALTYYDSTIIDAANFTNAISYILNARLYKSYVYFLSGDFQKGVEESTIGLALSKNIKDTVTYIRFLNQRSQSLFYQNKLQQTDNDINSAIQLAAKFRDTYQLATAYKTKGQLYAAKRDFSSGEIFFSKSIKTRLLAKRYDVVVSDYNDFGNFYRDSMHMYNKAKSCYLSAIDYAKRNMDSTQFGMINVNLTKTFFYEQNYKEAELSYLKEMRFLKLFTGNNFLLNPAEQSIGLIGNKHLITAVLQDKTALLLNEYKKNNNSKYLSATLQTARLTDSVITATRHEQTGEESKLYWRDKTREFYANSIEACYLAQDARTAFFFMEKSRAVLLNDKLNELGAAARLPQAEALKQENFQIEIIEQQQKLSQLNDGSAEYAVRQIKLLHAKETLEQYIKSLEQKFPAYYQYKYADEVPSLKDLQSYLAKNSQSFVHYFFGDTVTYILAITPNNTKFVRLAQKDFNKNELAQFLQLCASKEALNNNYNSFARLSNSVYKKIFYQLQLPKGRTVICADAIVIPFEALCTDESGRNFLLNDYSFSYVYSARFLMKQFNNLSAKGNFIGFAPVSFNSALDVQPLKNADVALNASAAYYKNEKLFMHENASRYNFFNYASSYSVISIFSHARADTTDNEPVLFMQDSVIHLSELHLLNNPATKLILLSACQTNAGKAAAGEGIYSLARGFATAGIPSVAATLWKADEQTIYVISEKFNQYLSEGIVKDEALQKAKLYFIQSNTGGDKLLPYYWANMILIGNADAIKFAQTSLNNTWIVIAAFILLTLTFIFIYIKKKNHQTKKIKSFI